MDKKTRFWLMANIPYSSVKQFEMPWRNSELFYLILPEKLQVILITICIIYCKLVFIQKNKFHTLLCKEKKATNCDTFKWRAYHKQKHCSKSNSWHTGTSFALTKHSLNWCFFWNRVKLFKDSLNRNWLLAIQYKTF